VGGGQGGATLRMGMHAYAMGEGRTRREPQRGGREDAPTTPGKMRPGRYSSLMQIFGKNILTGAHLGFVAGLGLFGQKNPIAGNR
jgi:hypothetical protein